MGGKSNGTLTMMIIGVVVAICFFFWMFGGNWFNNNNVFLHNGTDTTPTPNPTTIITPTPTPQSTETFSISPNVISFTRESEGTVWLTFHNNGDTAVTVSYLRLNDPSNILYFAYLYGPYGTQVLNVGNNFNFVLEAGGSYNAKFTIKTESTAPTGTHELSWDIRFYVAGDYQGEPILNVPFTIKIVGT